MDTYKKIMTPVIVAVAILAALSLVAMINISDAASTKADEASDNITYFKDFTLKGLDGETFTQEDLKKCKVTVFNGWAPWCGPCTGEIPYLDKLNYEYKGKGLQVVGVVADYYPSHVGGETDGEVSRDAGGEASMETDEEADGYDQEIRDVIASSGCRYPNMVSDEAFYNGPYITMKQSFPCTWAVDSDGNVIEIVHGAKSEETWRGYFDKWLGAE